MSVITISADFKASLDTIRGAWSLARVDREILAWNETNLWASQNKVSLLSDSNLQLGWSICYQIGR
jgi:hypothetical protein